MTGTDAADHPLRRELVTEALRRSSVLWLALPSAEPPRIAWYAYADASALVVHEGLEQALPGLEDVATVEVSVRSKDRGSLLVRFTARVEAVRPDDPAWAPAVAELARARQSPPDGAAHAERWERESRITRLVPLA